MLRINNTEFEIYFDAIAPEWSDLPSLSETTKSKPTTKHRLPTPDNAHPVGTLNGSPLYYIPEQPHTKIHCIGENFRPYTSVLYRNCEYERLCFDLHTHEYVLYEDDALASQLPHGWLSSTLRSNGRLTRNMDVSSQPRNGVANWQFRDKTPHNMFAPTVRKQQTPPSSHYYMDVAQLIFFRYKIGFRNPGHHGWQELVSLFALIDSFGHYDEDILITPLKKQVGTQYIREGDKDMMNKIGSKAFGHYHFQDYNPYWTQGQMEINITDAEFQHALDTNATVAPSLVCSKLALTGTGQVGAHATHFQNGTHKRPNHRKMYLEFDIVPYHHGNAGFFRRMRDWMLRNLGVEDQSPQQTKARPSRLLFAMNSSTKEPRASLRLDRLMAEMQPRFNDTGNVVVMDSHVLHDYSIEEQARMISRSKILFIAVGGATFPAIFLPPGSHLVLFYDHELLDWDYWNNIAHIRVHWIPYQHVSDPRYLRLFENFIREIVGLTSEDASPDRWGEWPRISNETPWDDVEANLSSEDSPVSAPNAPPSMDEPETGTMFVPRNQSETFPREGAVTTNDAATLISIDVAKPAKLAFETRNHGMSTEKTPNTVAISSVSVAHVASTASSKPHPSANTAAAEDSTPSLRGTVLVAESATRSMSQNVQNATAIL
jgi:hypothetical protein